MNKMITASLAAILTLLSCTFAHAAKKQQKKNAEEPQLQYYLPSSKASEERIASAWIKLINEKKGDVFKKEIHPAYESKFASKADKLKKELEKYLDVIKSDEPKIIPAKPGFALQYKLESQTLIIAFLAVDDMHALVDIDVY